MKVALGTAACVAALLLSNPAQAGDHGGYDWSGIYVGTSVGGSWGEAEWAFASGSVPTPNPQDIDGWIGGGHVGYQHQWGSFVLGVEGNFIFGDMEGRATCPNPAFGCNVTIDNIWEVGGRAGFATGSALIYATGGYASANVETSIPFLATGVPSTTSDERHDGYYIGGGLDWGITENIVLGVEYQHLEFGEQRHDPMPFAPGEVRRIDPDVDLVRARLTFKLDHDRGVAEPLK